LAEARDVEERNTTMAHKSAIKKAFPLLIEEKVLIEDEL
jgi:hypothetical protein